MGKLPPPILDYVYDLAIAGRSPGFLLLSREGRVLDRGGELTLYGLTGLGKNKSVGDQILALNGLFPMGEEGLELSCVETETGVSADIHIFLRGEECWVLFLDARREEARQTVLQQKTNDLSLLRGEHAKLLDQYLGKEITERLLRLRIGEAGERRRVSVLFADIRGFTAFSERESPPEVFRVLNAYLAAMIQPVFDEGGIVNQIIGDAVMAIFGLLPSELPPAHQSVKAAFRILDNIRILKASGAGGKEESFDAGIGVASGKVMLGILGTRNRKTLSAIGPRVGTAAFLETRARSREVLICENTFRDISEFRGRFSRVAPPLKNRGNPLPAYSGGTDQ